MRITDFTMEYVEQAEEIMKRNYEEERAQVPSLPPVTKFPELNFFAKNGLGVAALRDDELIGYWGTYNSFYGIHGTKALGIYSPVHAHGAINENRSSIYKRLYQEAAERWVKAGIGYHAMTLYHHDKEAVEAMFTYGFGHRCTDAIRLLEPITFIENVKAQTFVYREIGKEEVALVRNMRIQLNNHMAKSPCFMASNAKEAEEWLTEAENRDSRLFVAFDGQKPIAFMDVTKEGETFATEVADIRNICGAYCLPEYRGQKIYQTLLNYVIKTLKAEGYVRLGVDFESINPTAEGFWLKYFSPYTLSITRRIN